jgi:hypothetical protein
MGVTQGHVRLLTPTEAQHEEETTTASLQEVVVDRNPADELTDLLVLFCMVSFFGRLTRPDKRRRDGRP